MKTCINLSFNADHRKADGSCSIDAHEHWKMLESTVEYLRDLAAITQLFPWPVIISMTGFPGIMQIEARDDRPTRHVVWSLFKTCRFVTMRENPGHQQGAMWGIRMGVEAADKLGFDSMIHSAEDVLPHPGAIEDVVRRLEHGARYVGEKWGHSAEHLNAQFFGCNVRWFSENFDVAGLAGMHTEWYLSSLLEKDFGFVDPISRCYDHTHDPAEYQRMLLENRQKFLT